MRWEQRKSLGVQGSTGGVERGPGINQTCPSCTCLHCQHRIKDGVCSPNRHSQVQAAACTSASEVSQKGCLPGARSSAWLRAGPFMGWLVQLQDLGRDGDRDVMFPGTWKLPCVTAQGTRSSLAQWSQWLLAAGLTVVPVLGTCQPCASSPGDRHSCSWLRLATGNGFTSQGLVLFPAKVSPGEQLSCCCVRYSLRASDVCWCQELTGAV